MPGFLRRLEGCARWRGGALVLPALVALLVGARFFLVLCLADVFFYGEELAKGAAGIAMLSDLGLPHHQLAYLYYEGGGFVVSHLDALAFLVVGKNVLALKLVALCTCALILIAGYVLAERAFGRRTAVFFALLFILAPKGLQKLSLLALGIHFEALLFVLLVLHFGARVLFDDERPRTFAALGLASGFGIYFSYSVAPAVAYVGLALACLRPRVLLQRPMLVACVLGGFLIGFAPWIWTWSRVGREIFDIHGQELAAAPDVSPLAILTSHLRELFVARNAFEIVAMLALPLLAVCGLLTKPRGRALYLGLYLVVFLGVYFLSSFAEPRLLYFFHLKRLSQPWVLATLLGAVALARFTASPRQALRAAGWSGAAVLLLAGFLGTATAVRHAPPTGWTHGVRLLTRTKGFYWTGYVRALESHMQGTREEKLATLTRLWDCDPGYLYPVIAERLFRDDSLELDDVLARLRAVDAERWGEFLPGLGEWWVAKHGNDLTAGFAEVEKLQYALRRPLREALARKAIGYRVDRASLLRHLERARRQNYPEDYVRMLGYSMHLVLGLGREEGQGLDQDLPPLIFDPIAALLFMKEQEPRTAELLDQGWQLALRDRLMP